MGGYLMRVRIFIGFFIVLFGSLLLLNNLGITDFETFDLFKVFWPGIFIIWGFNFLTESISSANRRGSIGWSQLISGLVLFGLGIILLGRNIGWFNIDLTNFWRYFWPVIIIFVGLSLLRGMISGKDDSHFAIMSGVEKGKTPWKLKSDSYIAIMGGIELDLTTAEIPDEDIKLDLTAIMGGIDIKVPQNLNVICEGTVILGGLSFLGDDAGGIIVSKKTEQIVDPEGKVLRISAHAIMGGIDIIRR